MELAAPWKLRPVASSSSSAPQIVRIRSYRCFMSPSRHPHEFAVPFRLNPSPNFTISCSPIRAKKRSSRSDPVLKPKIVEEVIMDDDEEDELEEEEDDDDGVVDNEFDDDALIDGDEDGYFEDEYMEDDAEAELYAGDGAGGGGISLAGTWWDEKALAIAEEVSQSLDGKLQIYAFKTLPNSTIQVRIEKLSNRSGSPGMEDIEAFSRSYRARLDEAEVTKSVPENLTLEVSSPGLERVVRVPYDFDRFKERAMYVKYVLEGSEGEEASLENDGIFRLISFDMEARSCTWGVADIRVNREKAGKGRPLSKKQREWRLITSFDSLRLVRIYSEF